jgi:hypothetical protein
MNMHFGPPIHMLQGEDGFKFYRLINVVYENNN